MNQEFIIHSGIDTIGGNILEINTDRVRFFMDFGLSGGQAVDDQPAWSDLEREINQQALPQLHHVFELDQLEHSPNIDPFQADRDKPLVIAISHLHIDHMGALKFLPPSARIYLSRYSYRLLQTLVEVGEEEGISAQVVPLDPGELVTLDDDLHLQLIPVDHDVVGASAVFVQDSGFKIVHSGDLRQTGYQPDLTDQMVDLARNFQPDLLLMEGTSFSFDEDKEGFNSEAAMLEAFDQALNQDDFLVINPYPRNVDRLRHLNQVATQANRQIVWEESYAKLIAAFYPEESLLVMPEDGKAKPGTVFLDNIKAEPNQYVLQNSFVHLSRLADLALSGTYLHLNGEPLGDFDSHFDQLQTFLQDKNFSYQNFGVSGHATKSDLLGIAKAIGAKKTLAWHTFEPDKFRQALEGEGLDTFQVEPGEVFTAEDFL